MVINQLLPLKYCRNGLPMNSKLVVCAIPSSVRPESAHQGDAAQVCDSFAFYELHRRRELEISNNSARTLDAWLQERFSRCAGCQQDLYRRSSWKAKVRMEFLQTHAPNLASSFAS